MDKNCETLVIYKWSNENFYIKVDDLILLAVPNNVSCIWEKLWNHEYTLPKAKFFQQLISTIIVQSFRSSPCTHAELCYRVVCFWGMGSFSSSGVQCFLKVSHMDGVVTTIWNIKCNNYILNETCFKQESNINL